MAQITLVRIDDRLIHGQVVTAWLKYYDSDTILITDDAVAKDTFMQRVLKSAAPKGVKVKAKSIADTIAFLNDPVNDSVKTMIIVKGPEAVEGLIDDGIGIDKVILGGMGIKAGRKKLNRNISASEEEVNCMKRLEEKGAKIQYQLVPDDNPVLFSKMI